VLVRFDHVARLIGLGGSGVLKCVGDIFSAHCSSFLVTAPVRECLVAAVSAPVAPGCMTFNCEISPGGGGGGTWNARIIGEGGVLVVGVVISKM
jgi:hypothetical protein